MFNFLSRQAQPKWQFQKPGNLWRMLFLNHQRVIVEHRSNQEKLTSYVLLDQNSGRPLWDNFTLKHTKGEKSGQPVGDGWWVGLEYVRNNTVYFHSYSDPNNPEHLGIWAMDTSTQTIIWERPELSFICAKNQDEFLCYLETNSGGFAERSFFIIDAKTGADIENLGFDVEKANAIRHSSQTLEELQRVQLPYAFTPESQQFRELLSKNSLNVKPERLISGVDVIISDAYEIIGYHEQTDLMVNTATGLPIQALNYVITITKSNKTVYNDFLGKAMSGMIMDGFFLRENNLFYVRERDTLICLDLERL